MMSKQSTSKKVTPTAHDIRNKRQALKELKNKDWTIQFRNRNQKRFYDMVEKKDITFCTGPAGCGKTYLSVHYALKALADKEKLHREGKVKDAQGNIIPRQASMHNQTVTDVMDNLYPSKDKHGNPFKTLSEEEFLEMGGIDVNNPNEMNSQLAQDLLLDYNISSNFTGYSGGTGNLMGIPDGHTPIESPFFKSYPDFGGGGGGGIYGGGGGGGDAAAYAMMNQGPKQLGEGEDVLGQTPLQEYMVSVNKYNPYTKMALPNKANGGIMELVR